MAFYRYEAIDSNGNELEGTIEALGKEQAAAELRSQGLLIAHLEEVEEGEDGWRARLERWVVAFDTVKTGEIVMLFQQLATMIGNGLTLVRAMELLMRQRFSRKLRWVLKEMRKDMLAGQSFQTGSRQ